MSISDPYKNLGNNSVLVMPTTGVASGLNIAPAVMVWPGSNHVKDPLFRNRLLLMRLRAREGEHLFQDMHTSFANDKVFVFIVTKDQPLTLEDDAGMFPSDALITQLRLLMD